MTSCNVVTAYKAIDGSLHEEPSHCRYRNAEIRRAKLINRVIDVLEKYRQHPDRRKSNPHEIFLSEYYREIAAESDYVKKLSENWEDILAQLEQIKNQCHD